MTKSQIILQNLYLVRGILGREIVALFHFTIDKSSITADI